MKKIISIIMAACMLLALAACAANTGANTENTEADSAANDAADDTATPAENEENETAEAYNIYFICPDLSDESETFINKCMTDRAAETGVEYTCLDAQGNPQTQANNLSSAIVNGADAVILDVIDPVAIGPSLMEAQDAGLKVVIMCSDIDEAYQDYRDAFVGVDNKDAGLAVGKAMVEAFPNGCNVVEIGGMAGSKAQILRGDGFDEAIANYNINLLDYQCTQEWSAAQAQTIMEDFIVKYGDEIDAVFCHWDNGATGVIEALKNAGRDDVYVGACDGCSVGFQQVIDGTQDVCAAFDFTDISVTAFDTAVAILDGKDVPAVTLREIPTITADNVNEYDMPEW